MPVTASSSSVSSTRLFEQSSSRMHHIALATESTHKKRKAAWKATGRSTASLSQHPSSAQQQLSHTLTLPS